MDQHFQICQYQGHEGNKVKYICLDLKCQLKRSFCFKCLQDNHHSHGQEKNKNIFNHTEFETFIKRKIQLENNLTQEENDSFIQQSIKIISVVKFQIENISTILHELLTKSYLQTYLQSLQNKLETVSKTKLSQVDCEFISEILQMDSNQKRLQMKQEVNEQCDLLLRNTILLQQLSEKEIEKYRLKDSQYEGTQADQLSHQDTSKTPQMEQNDQKKQILGEDDKALQDSYCSFKGHEKNKIMFVCLDFECQKNKLVCQKCLSDNPHKHAIYDHNALQAQIQQKIDQLELEILKVDDLFVQRCIRLIKRVQQQMNNILENVEKIKTKSQIQKNIEILKNQLEIIKKTQLRQVDDKFIYQFSCITVDFLQKYKFFQQEIQDQCDLLKTNSSFLQQLSKKEELILKLKCLQFEQAQVGQMNDQEVQLAIISYDLKYVVSIHNNKQIKIWNYVDYKLILQYDQQDKMLICKFTDDSRLLYIGSSQGLLYCFNLYNNFEQTYKSKIHLHSILNLCCITNYVVLTSSFDTRIIKTNTQLKQSLLVIEAHSLRIDGLDFNRAKDVIASGSEDNYIKLWDNQGSLLIQKENEYQIINQVLFIDKYDQLISLDSLPNVKIWQIKYDSKQLLLINTLNDKNKIFNISLVLNQSFILLICDDYMKFYTIQGKYVHQIKHDIKEFYMMRQVQLDSIKSIIIQGQSIKIDYILDQLQIFKMII